MPDNFHALVEGIDADANVRTSCDRFRQRSGYEWRRLHKTRLWQEGYFDRILREEQPTLAVAGYIVANPVRGGLCEDATKYPYSGSSRYSLEELAEAVQLSPLAKASRYDCGRSLG